MRQLNRTTLRLIFSLLFAAALFYEAAKDFEIWRDYHDSDQDISYGFKLEMPWPSLKDLGDNAKQAGLEQGDILLQLEGKPFAGTESLERTMLYKKAGDSLRLGVHKKNGSLSSHTIALSAKPKKQTTLLLMATLFLTTGAIPIFLLILGFWVVSVRPAEPMTWIFFGLSLGFAHFLTVQVSFAHWPVAVSVTLNLIHVIYLSLDFLFIFLFGLYFPFEWRYSVRWPKLKWVVIVPLLLLSLVNTVASFITFLFGNELAWAISPFERVDDAFAFMTFVSISIFFVALGEKRATAQDLDAKRRLRILLYGGQVALAPIGLVVLHFVITKQQVAPPVLLAAAFITNLFPAALAYVVVVHRAFELQVVIRQGLQYTLARGGVRVIQGLLMLAIAGGGTYLLRTGGGQIKTVMVFDIVVGCMVLAVLLFRGRQKLFSWIDRHFFREAYSAELVLSELGENVRSIVDRRALLETVTHRLADTLHVQPIAMVLSGNNEYQPAYALGYANPLVVEFEPTSPTLSRLSRDHRALSVYFDDENGWINRDGVSPAERAKLTAMGSQLILPLTVKDTLIGFISLGAKRSEEPYSPSDIRMLSSVAGQVGMALENSRLTDAVAREAAQKERLNREIEIAREVQQRFFPQVVPVVAGLDLAGYCRPALGVGGDYYDFVPLENGHLGVAIGDVSGKGVPAALLMASLQAFLRGQAIAGTTDLAKLMGNLNRQVFDASTANRYATFFYSQYDPATRLMIYSNGGHNPPVIFRVGEQIHLETGGPVVGLFRPARYEQAEVQLQSGDILVAFTDGISEAMDVNDEEWGEENLAVAVNAVKDLPAKEMIPHLIEAADKFVNGAPQHDDMTIVVIKVL